MNKLQKQRVYIIGGTVITVIIVWLLLRGKPATASGDVEGNEYPIQNLIVNPLRYMLPDIKGGDVTITPGGISIGGLTVNTPASNSTVVMGNCDCGCGEGSSNLIGFDVSTTYKDNDELYALIPPYLRQFWNDNRDLAAMSEASKQRVYV